MKKKALKISFAVAAVTLFSLTGHAQDGRNQKDSLDKQGFDTVTDGGSASGVRREPFSVYGVWVSAADQRDYSISTSSIARLTQPLISRDVVSQKTPVCLTIAPPPAMLQTQSKYKADDSSKSAIDDDAFAARNKVVQPIRNAIRTLAAIAHAESETAAIAKARAECVLENADRWAAAKSLTEMRSVDAYLSRDRWVAEIALAVQAASRHVSLSDKREALYAAWLGDVAKDTIDAYSMRLGPKSRVNNHRYWAGLSVAAIGFLTDRADFKAWGKKSFEIGACQVDERGYLPAELIRGEKALEYHVYALRPLAAIAKLAADHDEPIESRCFDGFKRLTKMTREALANPTQFEQTAGMRQATTFKEASYSSALQLSVLAL